VTPSTAVSPAAPPPSDPAIRIAAGIFAGALLAAVVDVVAITLTLPLPAAGVGLRVAHLLFDAAETLGVGAVAAGVAGAFVRFVRPPRWAAWAAAIAATTVLVYLTINEGLVRVASLTLEGHYERALFWVYLAVLGLGIPLVYEVGVVASRRPVLRFVPPVLAIAGMAINHGPYPDDFVGNHGIVTWGAAMFGGAALGPLVEQAGRALARGRRGRVALGALALVALLGVVVPPPNAVRYELFRDSCVVAPWVLTSTLWRSPRLRTPVALPPSPWSQDRSAAPPVPPSSPRLLPRDAVVVLVTIDALRAEVVNDPTYDSILPTFAMLKRKGVVFTHASAPATQTALSLSTVFSGRYFSELLWTDHGVGRTRYLYPADDDSIRFPQLLTGAGVDTADFASLIFLDNAFGVTRGFTDVKMTVTGWRHARAHEVIDPLVDRLRHQGQNPIFAYTHLMEPHEPYDRGRKDGTPFERYVSEVAVADLQLGRVIRMLEQRLPNRWALFVSADHGEAFGEHRSFQHGKTLYEELLHVPLIAMSPHFPARVIEERVSLVDLGPTILDLFGVDTPPAFSGQSLVPLLGGGSFPFTRPLVAEGRLRQSLTQPDGFKVIEDHRRKLVEAYDLPHDPGELHNLYDAEPARTDRALAEMRAFFKVHIRTEGGYEVPYKP
jgi:arylsulfatase A-like enzyme